MQLSFRNVCTYLDGYSCNLNHLIAHSEQTISNQRLYEFDRKLDVILTGCWEEPRAYSRPGRWSFRNRGDLSAEVWGRNTPVCLVCTVYPSLYTALLHLIHHTFFIRISLPTYIPLRSIRSCLMLTSQRYTNAHRGEWTALSITSY